MHEVPPTVLTERRAIMSLNFVSSSPSRYVQLYPCILSYKRLSLCKMGPSPAAKRPFVALAGQKTIEDCIPLESFDNILKEMKAFDEEREQIIKRSRDIQKLSKQAIFSVHRGNISESDERLQAARTAAEELIPVISRSPALRQGAFSNSMEEYAEALILRTYVVEGRIPSCSEVALADNEEFLGGILDFTGELNRIAIARATARDTEAVQKARDCVEGLMGQFLRFDLRNGALRKKYDGLKYTLKKLENTLYELSLLESGLTSKPEDVPEIQTDDRQGEDE